MRLGTRPGALLIRKWLSPLLLALSLTGLLGQEVCNPNTQVCRTNTTLRSLTPYRGGTGSARIEYYPAPRANGSRKGVVVWVLGFGFPKPPATCLEAANTSARFSIDDDAVPYPVRLGFDVYVVDFCDPTEFLQRHADVVDRLYSERIAPTLAPSEKLGIVGNSMGGLVTLYTLTRWESLGRPHRTSLWLTNDSPLRGAYIPLSIQLLGEAVGSAAALGGADLGGLNAVVGLANTPAARQMLLAHHLGSEGTGSPHADSLQFFRELQSLGGFPRATGLRTVAIASGAKGNMPAHNISGVTWRYPIDRSVTYPVELKALGVTIWKSSIKIGFQGAAVLRLLPMTSQQQSVIRPSLEGRWYINNSKGPPGFSGDLSNSSNADIVGFLASVLHLDATIARDVLEFVLPAVAEDIKRFSRALIGGLNAGAFATTPIVYESLPGGLSDQYPMLQAAMRELPGTVSGAATGTFIPTFSAIHSNLSPNSPLIGTTAAESPFSRYVVQSVDRIHVTSETDAACEETRRLAGAPYVSSVSPAGRVAGQGSFTLEVTGGNFTAQSVVSFAGTQVPTAFVSSTRLTAQIALGLIAQPTVTPLFPEDAVPLAVPAIVAVNQYDGQGRLLPGQHNAHLANCVIGVVVQRNGIDFSPAAPTSQETFTANFEGQNNDSCVPQNPQVTRTGTEITVTAARLPGACFFALTPYTLRVSLGPLPAGEYRVTFRSGSQQLAQRAVVVTHPRPVITLLDPGDATAGTPAFPLTVEGAGFVRGVSEVYWNGQRRPTEFVSAAELVAQIPAADVANPGSAQVTVRNAPALVSAPSVLPILRAPPAISSHTPGSVVAGAGPVSLRITGTGFGSDARIVWMDGAAEPLPTALAGPNVLTTTLAAARIAIPGSYPLAVLSGGLTSAAVYLVVTAAPVQPTPPPPVITGAGNAASFAPGVSPGSIATLFGANFATGTTLASRVPLPVVLGGVQVMVAGIAAPLFAVTPGQINFQVPFEAPRGAAVPIWVVRDGVAGPQSSILIGESALGVFFYQREPGVRDPIITHADLSLVSPTHPARPGEVVIVWATGAGALNNSPASGAAAPSSPPSVIGAPIVAIVTGPSGGANARVLFAGLSPGSVGLLQINVEIPSPRPPDANLSLGLLLPGQTTHTRVPISVSRD